jgi:hypothetical protein
MASQSNHKERQPPGSGSARALQLLRPPCTTCGARQHQSAPAAACLSMPIAAPIKTHTSIYTSAGAEATASAISAAAMLRAGRLLLAVAAAAPLAPGTGAGAVRLGGLAPGLAAGAAAGDGLGAGLGAGEGEVLAAGAGLGLGVAAGRGLGDGAACSLQAPDWQVRLPQHSLEVAQLAPELAQQLPPLEHVSEPQQSLGNLQLEPASLQGSLQLPDWHVRLPQHWLDWSQLVPEVRQQVRLVEQVSAPQQSMEVEQL